MPADWRTVRVFISSTFRDMHSERDWLVKRVFPALRERLEQHRVHLIDIDLRWGITEEQASNDQVLDLCLDQIDECRPFFLGLLGQRYGWVPRELPDERSRHGWTQAHTGKSVTDLEIRWGVLLKPDMQDHALFFFRDPAFEADVPEAKRADVQAENEESAEKLSRLKDDIRSAHLPIHPVENYACRYAGLRINWGLARFDLDDADQQALEEVAGDGLVDNDEYQRLDDRLKEIVHRYGSVFLVGLKEFGQQVFEQLWTAISSELDLADRREETPEPLAEERGFHERFMESRLRVYVGRQELLDELTDFADGREEQPCLVTGPSGSGKSAALAKFADTYGRQHPETLVVSHFIGASPGSTSLRQTLHRLCSELKREFELDDDVPPDTNSLITTFRQFVTQVPENRRVVLVIDALNQLDESENAHQLYWLPWQFPSNVKLIVSCIDDPDREETVLTSFEHRQKHHVEVEPLTNEERFEIVQQVPLLSAKALGPRQIQLLLENPATTNPLYLLVSLEELRGFGSFEQLNRRIEMFPRDGDTITALFGQVIERLENEFRTKVVRDVLSLLSSARRGLSDRELLDLIEGTGVRIEDSTSDLFPVLRQLRPYLQHRAELWDFFHRNLYKAVRAKCLSDDETQSAAHARLAEYFRGQDYFMESLEEQRARARRLPPTPRPANIRKVDELPWQMLQVAKLSGRDDPESPHWDAVADLFTDLHFLEAKAEAQPYATATTESQGDEG